LILGLAPQALCFRLLRRLRALWLCRFAGCTLWYITFDLLCVTNFQRTYFTI